MRQYEFKFSMLSQFVQMLFLDPVCGRVHLPGTICLRLSDSIYLPNQKAADILNPNVYSLNDWYLLISWNGPVYDFKSNVQNPNRPRTIFSRVQLCPNGVLLTTNIYMRTKNILIGWWLDWGRGGGGAKIPPWMYESRCAHKFTADIRTTIIMLICNWWDLTLNSSAFFHFIADE